MACIHKVAEHATADVEIMFDFAWLSHAVSVEMSRIIPVRDKAYDILKAFNGY